MWPALRNVIAIAIERLRSVELAVEIVLKVEKSARGTISTDTEVFLLSRNPIALRVPACTCPCAFVTDAVALLGTRSSFTRAASVLRVFPRPRFRNYKIADISVALAPARPLREIARRRSDSSEVSRHFLDPSVIGDNRDVVQASRVS